MNQIQTDTTTLVELSYGHANRAKQLRNNSLTGFGIASGCKIFAAHMQSICISTTEMAIPVEVGMTIVDAFQRPS